MRSPGKGEDKVEEDKQENEEREFPWSFLGIGFRLGSSGPVILRGPSSNVTLLDVVQQLVSPATLMSSSDASPQQFSSSSSTDGLSPPVIRSTAGHPDRSREGEPVLSVLTAISLHGSRCGSPFLYSFHIRLHIRSPYM